MKKLIAILFLATAFVGCKKEEPKKEPRKANIRYTVESSLGTTTVWHEIDDQIKIFGQHSSLYLEVAEGSTIKVNWSRCLCVGNTSPVVVKIYRQMPWGEYKVMEEKPAGTNQGSIAYFVEELVW